MGIRRTAPAFVAALVALLTLTGTFAAAGPTVRVAGVLRLGFKVDPERMAVDSSRHKAYYVEGSSLLVLDLKRLRVAARKTISVPRGPFAVDTIRHKIFYAAPVLDGDCDSSLLHVLDGISLTTSTLQLPCDRAVGPASIDALSMDAPLSVLTIAGHRAGSTVVREMTVGEDGITQRWEIAQPGLCNASSRVLVAHMKYGTAGHCEAGGKGRASWIPTWHDMPVPDSAGRDVVRVTTTNETGITSALDRRTGRVAIARADGTVGVYDAPDERRVATLRQPALVERGSSAFDPESGRLYILGEGAIRSAEIRGNSATPSAVFPVNEMLQHTGVLAVDHRLHRIFVPGRDGLLAVQDDRPAIPPGSVTEAPATSDLADHAPAASRSESRLNVSIEPPVPDKPVVDIRPANVSEALRAASQPLVRQDTALRATWLFFSMLSFLMLRRHGTVVPLRAPPRVV